MINIIYSPKWFYGKDIIIDIISIFVLSLIAFYSIKYYRLNKKEKNYLVLAISFISLAVSFLFKILTNFTIYYHIIETKEVGFVTFTFNAVQSSNLLFFIGFLMYRLLTLLGLFGLYSIYEKQSKPNVLLLIYFVIISTYYIDFAYYIFHLTSLILLVLILLQYFKNYKKNKNRTTKLLFYSFSVIAISQVFFIFVGLNLYLYVISEILQLLGYIGLLLTFILVLKHGKKKG